jgi:plastocyanin
VTWLARSLSTATIVASTVGVIAGAQTRTTPAAPRTGTISGHITLAGKPPGNPVIRMGMDPTCADLNRGRQVIQEQALVTRDGAVANVFVRLEGNFPSTPVPATPVTIDQRSCVYVPRVVGVRVGQMLQIRNDDDLLHNVHSLSASSNSFNVGQPRAGAVFQFTPKAPEIMVKLGCDVHRWMTAFVAVMPHPYFAVTDQSGDFTIANVPPGRYTFKVWHEQFGEQSRPVTAAAGTTTRMDLSYPPLP